MNRQHCLSKKWTHCDNCPARPRRGGRLPSRRDPPHTDIDTFTILVVSWVILPINRLTLFVDYSCVFPLPRCDKCLSPYVSGDCMQMISRSHFYFSHRQCYERKRARVPASAASGDCELCLARAGQGSLDSGNGRICVPCLPFIVNFVCFNFRRSVCAPYPLRLASAGA